MSSRYSEYQAASENLKILESEEKEAHPSLFLGYDPATGRSIHYSGDFQHYFKNFTATQTIRPRARALIDTPVEPVDVYFDSMLQGATAGGRYSSKRKAFENSSEEVKKSEPMADSTSDEIKRLVAAIEERMDKRIERIEKDTDRRSEDLRREIALRDEALQRDTAALRELLKVHAAHTEEMGVRLERQFAEAKNAIGAQKYWIAGIGVAVVLGIMGANATIFSGGKSFFDSGVDRADVRQLLEEAKAQSKETRALLESLKAQQATPQAPVPAAPSASPAPTNP